MRVIKEKLWIECNNLIVFKIIFILNNRLDEIVKWYCMLFSGKVFYNLVLRLDINGVIIMVIIFEVNKIVINMD